MCTPSDSTPSHATPSRATPIVDLDLRGLKCPLPVLRTRKALRRLASGAALTVHCTDPLAVIDIPHMAREDGHRLEQQTIRDGIVTFQIRKGASS